MSELLTPLYIKFIFFKDLSDANAALINAGIYARLLASRYFAFEVIQGSLSPQITKTPFFSVL